MHYRRDIPGSYCFPARHLPLRRRYLANIRYHEPSRPCVGSSVRLALVNQRLADKAMQPLAHHCCTSRIARPVAAVGCPGMEGAPRTLAAIDI